MNQSEIKVVINASKEKTWDVLFNQYGDIHIHNPTMTASNYMHNATKGELNCIRHTEFGSKLFVDEKIAEVNENDSFKVVVTEHNLPFQRDMAAIYELTAIGDDRNETTEVKMTSLNLTFPRFMFYLMKGQQKKLLGQHLFGLKYYIETGKTVNKDNYSEIFNAYK